MERDCLGGLVQPPHNQQPSFEIETCKGLDLVNLDSASAAGDVVLQGAAISSIGKVVGFFVVSVRPVQVRLVVLNRQAV